MPLRADLPNRLHSFINRDRLVKTVVELVQIPSKTGDAGAVLDRLAGMLEGEGFRVERPAPGTITIGAAAAPIHEVMRPADEPSVIDAGAELIARLRQFGGHLATRSDPVAGCETVFIGQVHSGEIFNQYPQECRLEGTRRWLPGTARAEVEREFRTIVDGVARDTGTMARVDYLVIRDAVRLDEKDAV